MCTRMDLKPLVGVYRVYYRWFVVVFWMLILSIFSVVLCSFHYVFDPTNFFKFFQTASMGRSDSPMTQKVWRFSAALIMGNVVMTKLHSQATKSYGQKKTFRRIDDSNTCLYSNKQQPDLDRHGRFDTSSAMVR